MNNKKPRSFSNINTSTKEQAWRIRSSDRTKQEKKLNIFRFINSV